MQLDGKHQKVIKSESDFRLTYGRVADGRKLAIITSGGHPQIANSGPCTVCDVKVCKTLSEAKTWFRKAIVTRPWETYH